MPRPKLYLDPDVLQTSKQFGLAWPELLAAVEIAEGNLIRAVQCSVTLDPGSPEEQRREALAITARSAIHAMRDFLKWKGLEAEFVEYWAARWAPVGAANDPQGLNANWPRNVTHWLGLAPVAKP